VAATSYVGEGWTYLTLEAAHPLLSPLGTHASVAAVLGKKRGTYLDRNVRKESSSAAAHGVWRGLTFQSCQSSNEKSSKSTDGQIEQLRIWK
jgi:uncharacterized membrane protein YebE (DUF533 family)